MNCFSIYVKNGVAKVNFRGFMSSITGLDYGRPSLVTTSQSQKSSEIKTPAESEQVAVAPESSVVSISNEARLRLQAEDAASTMNGDGTIPPDPPPAESAIQPPIITPMNGDGTLPPDPPKSKG